MYNNASAPETQIAVRWKTACEQAKARLCSPAANDGAQATAREMQPGNSSYQANLA
jgi:hypothetical protein